MQKKFSGKNRIKSNSETLNNKNITSKHTWLNANDNDVNCKADEYFKDISYFIDLQSNFFNPDQKFLDLYKVIDTCYYNEKMNFIPVLVEIK